MLGRAHVRVAHVPRLFSPYMRLILGIIVQTQTASHFVYPYATIVEDLPWDRAGDTSTTLPDRNRDEWDLSRATALARRIYLAARLD